MQTRSNDKNSVQWRPEGVEGGFRPGSTMQGTNVGAKHSVRRSAQEPVKVPTAAYLKARITGRLHSCLIDSGADVSLAPSQLVDPALLRQSSTPLVADNNTGLIVDGIATLPVTVNGTKTFADFIVTSNIDEVSSAGIGFLITT